MSGNGIEQDSFRASRTEGGKRRWGFDLARLIALGMVVCQHVETQHGIESKQLLPGLDVGQLGVIIFCALSGFLAFANTNATTGHWLIRRFERIYVPLWLTLIPVFAANSVLGYKPADGWLIASQFAGIGYFTHPNEMVGVHLWFISLIVLCYVLAAAARSRQWLLLPMTACAVVAAIWHVPMASYVVAFLAAGLSGLAARPFVRAAALCLVAAAAARLFAPAAWTPAAVGLFAIAGALLLSSRWTVQARSLQGASDASYHFYLVHGPAYLVAAKLAPVSLFVDVLLGSAVALFATWGLYWLDVAIREQLRRAAMRLSPKTA